MKLLGLRIVGDQLLTRKADAVVAYDDRTRAAVSMMTILLAQYRKETGYGRAIAAPQIGESIRLIVMNLGGGPVVLMNPIITWRSDAMQTIWDDCLSVPDHIVLVERHSSISIQYTDTDWQLQKLDSLNASESELLQHEIDHLDGVLMDERAVLKDGQKNIRPISDREMLMKRSGS